MGRTIHGILLSSLQKGIVLSAPSYLWCRLGFLRLDFLLFGLLVVTDGLHGCSGVSQDTVIATVDRVWLRIVLTAWTDALGKGSLLAGLLRSFFLWHVGCWCCFHFYIWCHFLLRVRYRFLLCCLFFQFLAFFGLNWLLQVWLILSDNYIISRFVTWNVLSI